MMALRFTTTAWDGEMRSETVAVRTMVARFAGTCRRCGDRFPVGAEIVYDRSTRTARHFRCPVLAPPRYETFKPQRMHTGCDGCVRSTLRGGTMTRVIRADGAIFIYCTHCQKPRDTDEENRIADAADALLDQYDVISAADALHDDEDDV